MANLKDIAQKANVSIATVSKVLNGNGNVNPETIESVLSIARELNYQPNIYALGLKKGRSRAIGVITEDITVFNTPEIIDGVGACCEERNYFCILGNMRLEKRQLNSAATPEKYEATTCDAVNKMIAMRVDGIIYLGCHSHSVFTLPKPENIHCVCAYCYSTDPQIPSVQYNDRLAAYQATELLIKTGRGKIGVVAGPSSSIHTTGRLLGCQEALFSHGIPYNPAFTLYGDWGRGTGYKLGGQLIEAGVTAIFAHNDLMALGVIDYCNKSGLEVGRDIALVGFDNREISSVCSPTLSTVMLPLYEIGYTAAEILLDVLEGKPVEQPNRVLLDCTVIERESTYNFTGA